MLYSRFEEYTSTGVKEWPIANEYAVGLPLAVRSVVEARTGKAVFMVGPDYRTIY
jgi:hypothetical protein